MAGMNERAELSERLDMIEGMIGEGRRTTVRWGWTFVLWGVAYCVAMGWVAVGGETAAKWAWPVTMLAAGVVNGVLGARVRRQERSVTTVGRAMMAIWTSMGLALFLFGVATGMSRHWEPHVMVAAIETILGMAFLASGIILRWRAQIVCGLVWWATALVALFGTIRQAGEGFLAGTVVCMIGFGLYMMVMEGRWARGGVRHA